MPFKGEGGYKKPFTGGNSSLIEGLEIFLKGEDLTRKEWRKNRGWVVTLRENMLSSRFEKQSKKDHYFHPVTKKKTHDQLIKTR